MATNPYLDLMEAEDAQQRARQAATLQTAVDANPDEYATQKRVASYLGYAPAAVEATPEASKREAQVKQVQDASATRPVLARKYTDDDFARLAHDDSDPLGGLVDQLAKGAKYLFGANEDGNTIGGTAHRGAMAFAAGAAGTFRAASDLAAGATEFMYPALRANEQAGFAGGNPLRRVGEGFGMMAREQFAKREALLPKGPQSLVSAGVDSGVESLVQSALSLPLALMTGGESAALAAMAGPQGGQSYHKAREAGVPESVALAYGISDAAIEFATERLPLGRLLADVKSGTSAIRTAVHQVLPEVIGEQIATALQDANEWAVMPENAKKTFKDYLADRPAAAVQTLIATLVGIGGHVGVMKSIQGAVDNSNGMQRQVEAANDGAEHLKALFSAAASSKLRERDPQTFAAFVHEASDDAGAPTEVYVDARVLAGEGGLFNQEKVAEILPSVAEHLPAALAAGTDVAIPVGELLAQAGTGIEQKLLEHLRTTPDGLSQAEAKEASKLAEEYLQKQAERVMADAVDRTDIEQSAEQVKAQILEQLKAANRFTPDVHDAYASLVRDFYTVTSQRLGIAPAEMFQRYPLRIAAANPAAGNLDQSVFHGTAAKFDRFSLDHIGSGEGSQSFGWGLYFAGNKSVAKFYKKWAEVNQGKTGGRVVKVEVPEHDVLLDYDAKLSDQPTAVQAALEKLGVRLKDFNVVSPSGEVLASHESSEKARAFITRGNVAGKVVETPTEMTGKRAYSLLATMLGSDRAASEALAGAGVPGLHYGDALSRNKVAAEKTRNYVIFDDRVISEPETVFGQGPRGTFNPASLTISLLEQADLSTFLHESGHFFLEVTADLASQPDAPAGLADDMGALLKWFGVKDIATWNGLTLEEQRPHHEKFAEAFEQYLFEGKAPSHELAPLFARFRAWLTNVYRSLTQFAASHNTHLNDEVRKVFDRMLAADDAIKAAEAAREYAPVFESAEQARMDPVAWLAYQEQGQAATDKAVEKLQTRSLRDMRWASNARSKVLKKLQREAAARRKQVETEVKAEVSQDPVYAVQHFIAQNENAALEPEVVAEMFGFTSADHMQKAIAAAQPEAVVVEGMTDQRLLERYGDLTTVQGLERAADEAVHNDARARFVATELRALMEAGNAREKTPRGGSVNVIQRAAKEFASALVARRKVRDLKPGQHLQAETRAARAAEKALAASDTQGAVVAKRDQLLNHYAARMAQDAQAEIEKRVAWLKKIGDSDALPPEYREQIQKLLERFDLRKATNKELDRRASLAEWVESQRAIGIEPELPDGLLNEATRQNYRDMTVEEFRGLVDTVKQIEHLGRLKDKLLTAKDQRAFGEIVQSITASIEEHADGRTADTRTPTTNWGRAIDSVKKFAAAHIKSAMFARVLDGGKDGGPVWEHLIRPANVAGDFETTKRAEATKALEEILAPLFKRGALGGKGTYFASIGRSLNRESVIAIALNTGNKGNLQRLLGGEGWTLDQVQPVLDTLTKDEWTVVQKVWDYFETLRPLIAAKEMRVFGKEPAWIDAGSPVTDALGMRGGYYPIKYDPAASQRAEEHADAEGARRQLQGAYGAATTRRSFTKTRAEEVTGRPLLYTMAGLYQGVNDVIHDLAWHEWLIDANRLLRSTAIDTAIRSHYGPHMVRQLKSWRDAVAEGDGGAQEAIDMALGRLRQGVSAAGLAFNVMSALMQPLGATQSIVRIGAQHFARGAMQYLANPVKATREVHEQSEFMANRARTRWRELNELRNKVQGQTAAKQKLAQYSYLLMMQMQQTVDVPTWLGAYEKALAAGSDEERSRSLADQAVIDSQGGGQTKDLAAIERGGPAQKLFTVFYSFMNTAQNLGYASRNTGQSKAKVAADTLMIYVVPALLGSLLKDALVPGNSGDWDDWRKIVRKLLGEQISYVMGMFVVGREFAEAGKTAAGATDHPRAYAGPAGVRVISDVGTLAKQAKQGEFDDAFRKALVNVAGDILALPSAQINRTVTGAKAIKEGKTHNPAALVFGYQEPHP
jgi:hypothetical protein